MYRLGEAYELMLEEKMFFTGIILEEDSDHIKMKTIKQEEIIIKKENIVRSMLLNEEQKKRKGVI